MICVSLARTRHGMMIAEHQALAKAGAELVELRVDWLSRTPELTRLLTQRPTPVVFTCRRPVDGGRWNGTEEERLTVLRAAIVAGVDYVDLEKDVSTKIRRYGKTQRIISYHNFEQTPDDIESTYAEMTELDADVLKIVTMANSPRDCVRVLKLAQGAKIPTIAFCMGEFGLASRVLCGRYGAPFTYATFSKEREIAPGQLSFDEMRKLYRYDSIGPETKVFGVLGDPIGHSLSPLLHNTAFRKLGMNAVYLPIRLPPDEFATTLDDYEWLGVRGYSVTIPHKEAALAKYPKCDDEVRVVGAANTIYKDSDQHWRTANTDLQAAMASLTETFREGESLEGKRVLMLGAGGAARALARGVMHRGASVVVTSRTSARAKAFAEELGCRFCTWENRGSEGLDILINCTPVGMSPNVDDSPFQQNWLQEEMLVFDTIYNPEQTLLIRHARERGCRTVTGVEMFVRQAAAQFELFTGQPQPIEIMRETLRRGISAAKRNEDD
jgi:3-dehydroquinate dehydratase / shikimate dehydrogenase